MGRSGARDFAAEFNLLYFESEFPTDADGGGGMPTTFPSGQTPSPWRTGMKYPVRESLTWMCLASWECRYWLLLLGDVEVRDSRTGYFIPVRYGLGV